MLYFCPPICTTGPVSPQTVAVASAGSDHLTLRWNVSAFMQMTPHTYNVTRCSDTCDTLFFTYTDGAAVMNVSIRSSSPDTEYFIEISSSVVRIDSSTGRNTTLRSSPIVLQVRTGIYLSICLSVYISLLTLKLQQSPAKSHLETSVD